jgi:Flp pilus assembly protein TadG
MTLRLPLLVTRNRKRPLARGALRRGVAAVEMAVLLPLFAVIAVGAVDVGRFAVRTIAVANAARAGAGYGILHPFTTSTQPLWTANVRQAVVDDVQSIFDSQFGLSNLTVTSLQTTDPDSRWRVRVTVTFPFQTLFTWPGFPRNTTITEAVEMRSLR